WLRLVHDLGGGEGEPTLEWPVSDVERRTCEELSLPIEFIVLHPGASVASRCWPPQHCESAARALAADGHAIVVTGTAAERARCAYIGRRAGVRVTNLVGQTDLGLLGAVLERAALL